MEIDKMNWRDVARKPFELVGMDAPRETVRVLRHRLFGAPYVWTDFPPVIQISTNNYCGPGVCGVLCEYCFPQWHIARGKDYPGELSMEVLEWIFRNIGRYGRGMWYYSFFLDNDGLADLRNPEIFKLARQLAPDVPNET